MIKRIALAGTTLPVLFLVACASQDSAAGRRTDSTPTASDTGSAPAKSAPTVLPLGNVTESLLSDHRGKILILNFFATWCPPCIREMNEFKTELWPKIESNPNVVLLSIAEDDNRADVERWLKREKPAWKFLWDQGGKLFGQYTQDGTIPQLVVFDKTGKVTATQTGFAPGLAQSLLQHLKALDT